MKQIVPTRPRFEVLEDRTVLSPGTFAMHIHPSLTITINGIKQTIPANIGISPDGQTFHEIHTHDATGTLHVETNSPRNFRLDEFFAIWGQPFSSQRILGYQASPGQPVTMTINNVPSSLFGAMPLNNGNTANDIDISVTGAVLADPLTTGPFFAVGGENGRVHIYRKADGVYLANFSPYGPSFTGLVNVEMGDLNADGYGDIITGIASGAAQVKVFSGKTLSQGTLNMMNPDGALMSSFFAFPSQYNVGVNLAVGRVTGSSKPELILGANVGNPHVKVIPGQTIANGLFGTVADSKLLTNFFAYGLNFNVGTNVAVGDVAKNGFADIVTSANVGNPHVKVYRGQNIANGTFNSFNPDASLRAEFFSYGLNFNVGAYVAVGDVNADGYADVITGASTGAPHVKVYNGQAIGTGTFNNFIPDNSLLTEFFAYETNLGAGVRVAAGDFNGDAKADILTGPTAVKPNFRVVSGLSIGVIPLAIIDGTALDFTGGISVGA